MIYKISLQFWTKIELNIKEFVTILNIDNYSELLHKETLV